MKLDLICGRDDLRPEMTHVKVTKEVMVATNAHVIGVIPTKLMFSEDFIAEIPESGILIHYEDWKKLSSSENVVWKSEDVIRVIYKGSKRDVLIQVDNEDNVGKFPNWEAVFPTEQMRTCELNKVGLNLKLALDLQNALGLSTLALQFSGASKAIYVSPISKDLDDGRYGLIMPVMLT